MQQTPDLDPFSAFIAVFAVLVGPSIAPYAATYSVIFFGSIVGILIGLRSRKPSSRLSAALYMIITFISSLFMTVPLSDYIGQHYSLLNGGNSWLFFPVAMCITAYGELWINYLKSSLIMLIKHVLKGAE